MSAGPRRPVATYRLQLGPHLDLAGAAELAPYLHDLGVSHLYLSPITTAAPGSIHGYDVVDPNEVSPALGGEEALRRLADVAHRSGMGLMVDVVPNHMSTDAANRWWTEVLRLGPAAEVAGVFDIDWHPAGHPDLDGKVLLPVLDRPLDEALAAGALVVEPGRVRHHDVVFPLAPGTGDGDPREALEQQHYRLEHWRSGRQRVNWRRFFALTELVGVRVEDPAVFDRTHELLLRLAAEGVVDALRIDHVDGLADPEGYLARLRERLPGDDFPVVVEKILGPEESLRPWWPVDGTTGYDFLDRVNGLFADPTGVERLVRLHREVTGRDEPFEAVAQRAKREIVDRLFAADVDAVVRDALAGAETVGRDELHSAVVGTTVALPVYRTYLRPSADPAEVDRMLVVGALADARRGGATAPSVEHLRAVLLGEDPPSTEAAAAWARARTRWQQLTGPVMAKGVEDTACYSHVAVAGLNDVGTALDHHVGDPAARFHDRAAEQAQRWPGGLNATATHDTKRGEDTRLRMVALTTMAEEWARAVAEWHEQTAGLQSMIDGAPAPDPGDQLLLYQTVVGTWNEAEATSTYVNRLTAYAIKSAREAKRRTSWLEPHEQYERGLSRFVAAVVEAAPAWGLTAWAKQVAAVTAPLSLAQVVLKIASPGVPDLYQGSELGDLSLVDPDNRRPVDFAERRDRLDRLDGPDWSPADPVTEADKLMVTAQALRARRRRPALYREGRYLPLEPHPPDPSVVAFAREHNGGWAMVVARTRAGSASPNVTVPWPDGAPDAWVDILSGRSVTADRWMELRELLHGAPVVLLEGRQA